ncbi:uroporphyrin-3 C-methyltransferase [Modicisalibacter muralis]|uniref:Uroporphyrin-3 C-methyltransferase n=1 Tax=Modicisalibacter muralis TaxID=119000 RepID=A0A1G9NKY2_9GAMM|nr:uroporphyrinogen-III C-methyltransferase [Halomonas muralis]SDL86973.1 uroporphyrin-3 C-methyltransferase [Halomonas muralis]
MSKQEHDQDEPRAPSGAGKSDAPTDASQASTTDDESRSTDQDAASHRAGQKAADSDKRAAPGAKGEEDSAKSTDGNADRPASKGEAAPGGESASASKSTTQPEAPRSAAKRDSAQGKDDAQGKKAQGDKRQDKTPSAASGSAKSSTTTPGVTSGSGAASAGTSTTRGGQGDGGKAGKIALVLVVLLALVVLIGGWWGWQMLADQRQRLAQVESNASAIAEIESQLDQRDRQREQALQGMRDELQQYRESVNQTLDKVLAKLASEQQADPSDWIYAEVEYLLRLANQRLQLERDVEGAEALLRSADERLAQADNPALTPVRRAIQSELAALASVPRVDSTGLYLTLMAQQEQLAQLPLEQDVKQIAAKGGDTSPVSGGWRDQLTRFGQELKDLVVVRKHDQALEALLTPEQEAYLRQNVRLQLEQAQLALLNANPQLYRASLEKAVTLIEDYYDTDNQGVAESLEQLRTLADKTIRPELPDISGSLQALRDFMERRRDAGSADA